MDAFMFVSSGMQFENEAVLNKETGAIFYRSEFSDLDEFPEDIDEDLSDKFVTIPHKNEIDLGRDLVFRFAESTLPDRKSVV